MKILCEALNASKKGGTGISTYIRSLAKVVGEIGHAFDGLLHSFRSLDRNNAVAAEIEFFDVNNREVPAVTRYVEAPLRFLVGSPMGIRGLRLPGSKHSVLFGAEGLQGVSPSSGGFTNVYAARMFDEFSKLHFDRYGGRTTIRTEEDFDLFHATHPIPLMKRGAANIYTIHDLVPLRLPYSSLDDKRYFFKLVKHLARKADHIVTVSESSRRDIIALTGIEEERITNTYQAVHLPSQFLSRTETEISDILSRVFQVEFRNYYLFLGALEPKKNVARLVDAYLASGSGRPLIIVGGLGWEYQSDLEKIERKELSRYRIVGSEIILQSKIRRMGYLPLSHVIALLQGARALLFPSLYEGFGLPVLEAMTVGTPVITSNVSSLPEVAGDAALLIDPLDISSLAGAIAAVDDDDQLCADLSVRGLAQSKKFSHERYRENVQILYSRFE